MLLENKTAVIYGAGGAIGGAVADAFAREGARVFLTGRNIENVAAVAGRITPAGGSAEAAVVDALDQRAVEAHLDQVIDSAGGLDISFNAIGIPYTLGVSLPELTPEVFSGPIAEVMRTQFITTTAAARHMTGNGSGVILAITAPPGSLALADSGNFGVACAAIEGLCRQLAADLGPQGVRVVCLRSAGSSDALQEVFAHLAQQQGTTPELFEAGVAATTLLKRLPLLVEVGNAAALMASDHASAMTGTVADITCGTTVN
jgi:3-oxoacyl-[acyl-carrier protein] reductase